MGPAVGTLNGSIQFLNGGTLLMGLNSYIGTIQAPINALVLATNTTLSLSVPSFTYSNIEVGNLTWPNPDNNLTFAIAAMPAGINPGQAMPLLSFSNVISGTINTNDPRLSLPPGVTGFLTMNNNNNVIDLTITGGVGPGTGGVNQLLNPGFELTPAGTDWTTAGTGESVLTTNASTFYPNTGGCSVDTRVVQDDGGTNVAKITGSFVAGGSTNSWSQSTTIAAGSTMTASACHLHSARRYYVRP